VLSWGVKKGDVAAKVRTFFDFQALSEYVEFVKIRFAHEFCESKEFARLTSVFIHPICVIGVPIVVLSQNQTNEKANFTYSVQTTFVLALGYKKIGTGICPAPCLSIV
jgi:hypothetical protein